MITPIHQCLVNKKTTINPIWFMRQAGRYLPEFREIRKKNPDFIKLCLNPSLVNEITLQPLKRFDLDAAIIFSDILMIPYGLGQKVEFKKGLGPVLGDIDFNNIINIEPEVFVARLLRIIRVLRIITVVPAFRHIIDSLIKSIPRVGFIALLMFIFMYVWGAIGTMFFGTVDPENWGNIGLALITLVQVATYDDWAAIMGNVIEVYPYAWIFFVSFIIINAVILLNMVIGVIVDVMTGGSKKVI